MNLFDEVFAHFGRRLDKTYYQNVRSDRCLICGESLKNNRYLDFVYTGLYDSIFEIDQEYTLSNDFLYPQFCSLCGRTYLNFIENKVYFALQKGYLGIQQIEPNYFGYWLMIAQYYLMHYKSYIEQRRNPQRVAVFKNVELLKVLMNIAGNDCYVHLTPYWPVIFQICEEKEQQYMDVLTFSDFLIYRYKDIGVIQSIGLGKDLEDIMVESCSGILKHEISELGYRLVVAACYYRSQLNSELRLFYLNDEQNRSYNRMISCISMESESAINWESEEFYRLAKAFLNENQASELLEKKGDFSSFKEVIRYVEHNL